MGCFSWFTQDKKHKRIVIGEYLDNPIYMVGKVNGQIVSYSESCYGGYGVFGGKDYYVFMAELNGKTLDDYNGDINKMRSDGIHMAFDNDSMGYSRKWVHPSLSLVMNDWKDGVPPECDPNQGFATH